MIYYPLKKRIVSLTGIAFALAVKELLGQAALADVTVVTTVAVAGGPSAMPQSLTTYSSQDVNTSELAP